MSFVKNTNIHCHIIWDTISMIHRCQCLAGASWGCVDSFKIIVKIQNWFTSGL